MYVHCTNPLCSLPKDSGMCRGLLPRFYFDQETKLCEEFNWGGKLIKRTSNV